MCQIEAPSQAAARARGRRAGGLARMARRCRAREARGSRGARSSSEMRERGSGPLTQVSSLIKNIIF